MKRAIGIAAVVLGVAVSGFARGTPDWVKAAAATTIPTLPNDPRGVVLLDESTTTVSASGEIRTLQRTVWKVLTSGGRDLGEFAIRCDAETRLKSLHAWTITSGAPVLSAHVVVTDDRLECGSGTVLDALQRCVAGHFDVEHSTFQLEVVGHADHEPGRHS